MSPSNRPPPPTMNPRLARDVAMHLDRRRMRRRLVGWSALLAAVAAGAMYLRCGDGFGLGGGKGPGEGPGSSRTLTEKRRCVIRVTAGGITVDGETMLRDQAVEACKATAGADIVITGDAREGNGEDLKRALEAAGVPTFMRDRSRAGSAHAGSAHAGSAHAGSGTK